LYLCGIEPVKIKKMSKRKHFPIVGTRFGEFTVIDEELVKSKDAKILYHVKCSCGKEQFVRAYFLEVGRQTCCKECRSKINYEKAIKNGTSIGFIKLHHEGIGNFTKTAYNHFKRNAKRRDIEWSKDLTLEFLYNLLLNQNRKCALSGVDIDLTEFRKGSNVNFEFMTASLDRIDSSKDYNPTNVQWVHKDVNRMKWALDQDYFI